jgi:hypothetical protein
VGGSVCIFARRCSFLGGPLLLEDAESKEMVAVGRGEKWPQAEVWMVVVVNSVVSVSYG